MLGTCSCMQQPKLYAILGHELLVDEQGQPTIKAIYSPDKKKMEPQRFTKTKLVKSCASMEFFFCYLNCIFGLAKLHNSILGPSSLSFSQQSLKLCRVQVWFIELNWILCSS